nr:hypothetical protein [uncultured Rhodopila sp.]
MKYVTNSEKLFVVVAEPGDQVGFRYQSPSDMLEVAWMDKERVWTIRDRCALLLEDPSFRNNILAAKHGRQVLSLEDGQEPVFWGECKGGVEWDGTCGMPSEKAWRLLRGLGACGAPGFLPLHSWGGSFVLPQGHIGIPEYFEVGTHIYSVSRLRAAEACADAGIRFVRDDIDEDRDDE